jgi:hypothetical protein
VNLRLTAPKAWLQAAVNLQMIEVQFDDGNVLGKVTARV